MLSPTPTPLFSTATMRTIDAAAMQAEAVNAHALMGRAGAAALGLLRKRWPDARRIGIACGPGNNGGDGYVLARLALEGGLEPRVISLAGNRVASAEALLARSEWKRAGGDIGLFEDGLPEVDLWVDALFGIGLKRAPQGDAAALVEAINDSGKPVLALDLPSGLDSDSGAIIGSCIRADLTITFIASKRGLHTGAALDRVGELVVDGLDVPDAIIGGVRPEALLATPAQLEGALPSRRRDSHKGDHGRLLCIGGGPGMGGAIRLCAEAALRAGAGLVTVATCAENVAPLLAARPELMPRAMDDGDDLAPLLAACDVLAIGPGLGQGEWASSLLAAAIAAGKPMLLDADGLNLLAKNPRSLPDAILTPHPGEAARLLGSDTVAVQRDRFAALDALVQRFGCVVVLKGAGTLVGAPGETIRVIGAGNPGMAVGGMGDVLAGVIAALRVQGLPAFEAATIGALLHSTAGDAAAREGGERGLLASDLFPPLRRLANLG